VLGKASETRSPQGEPQVKYTLKGSLRSRGHTGALPLQDEHLCGAGDGLLWARLGDGVLLRRGWEHCYREGSLISVFPFCASPSCQLRADPRGGMGTGWGRESLNPGCAHAWNSVALSQLSRARAGGSPFLWRLWLKEAHLLRWLESQTDANTILG
jgi:hypothetical protein